MKLIDADSLSTYKMIVGQNPISGQYNYVTAILVSDIDNAETIEAAPIRHAYWEHHSDIIIDVFGYKNYDDYIVCSSCKERNDAIEYNYCPHCGAKMDEVI